MKTGTKKLTLLALFTAGAMLFSYIEMLLPPILPSVPGIKMGLPNIIIIFVLYRFSLKEAAAVSLVRIFLTALLFGNAMTLIYSIAGASLSLAAQWLVKKWDRFSVLGVSIVGGVFHNLGQVLTAAVLMQTREIIYYMAVLLFSGILSGIIVGLLAFLLIKAAKKHNI